jgi:hypothetical protein
MLTNTGLVAYAKKALAEGWGYVWGTFGQVLTQTLFEQKMKQYPSNVGKYKTFIAAHWLGKKTADCVGLIKSYIWFKDGRVIYNNKTDVDANTMYDLAKEKGPIVTILEIPGLCLWKQGHIGVYIGNGEVIEAHGTTAGVIKTPLKGKGATPWTHWLKCPFITYETVAKQPTPQEIALGYAVADKAITSPDYWAKVFNGQEPAKPEYIMQLITNYHNELEKAKGNK